jgi:hypothetical protein
MKFFLTLTFLTLSLPALSDSLSLYFIESPLGINWKSPWTMTMSTLKNQVAPTGKKNAHSISHTYAEIDCASTGAFLLRGMTSITNDEERELIFKKKYGLGVIFHTFKGRLEKNEDLARDLEDYWGDRRTSKLTIKISPATCQRLVDYADEFEAKGYGLMYSGLQADPLKGEGAGCSAFAVSFLRVGGLMQPFVEQWKDIINVPKKLIGGPLTNQKVPLTKLVRSVSTGWSSKVPHIPLEAWNPERMHRWLLKEHRQPDPELSPLNPTMDQYRDSKILTLDMEDLPTPEGSFWL